MMLQNYIYTFRDESLKFQFEYLHPGVKRAFYTLCELVQAHGYKGMEITSMIRKKKIPGESGVHETGRAIDCMPEPRDQIDQSKCLSIQDELNRLIPRTDGHRSCIWHDVGIGWHFHLQVPQSADYKDLRGVVAVTTID